MHKAYDALLQTAVSAENAAANTDNEPFRYECLCCGEEVFLAAQDSVYKATHFRHRSGNNDKDCELYLGQYGLIPASPSDRSKRQDRVEFYYQNLHKAFYMSFRFNDSEIAAYESVDACIQVRAARNQNPFFSKIINHTNFYDDVPETYMIEINAETYYISNTVNNIKREYQLFKIDGPSFFKISGEESDFTAKFVKSRSLYTNVKYFIAWPGRNTAQIYLSKVPGVQIDEQLQFKTMNNCNVWALVATFTEKNPQLDALLQSWGYDLSASEEILLLWPPSYEHDETLNISSNNVFVYSSFALQAFGNTNMSNKAIHKIDTNVTKVDVDGKLIILKKNAEMTVETKAFLDEFTSLNPICVTTKKFVVPEDGVFFHFSSHGVEKLSSGQMVFLTDASSVVEYKGNYIHRVITMTKDEDMSLNEKIQQALMYYWVFIPYDEKREENYSTDILKYLQENKVRGHINKAILSLIEEKKYE